MALWMVRSGKHGEREQFNLEHSIVSIDWGELPDLQKLTEKPELTAIMVEQFPDEKPSAIRNWVGQVWTFAKTIKPGDLVAMPLKSVAAIEFGNVVGDYEYRSDFVEGSQHSRKVEWLKSIPRTAIDPDLLFSFGAIMTVCNIDRHDAENRVRALLSAPLPSPGTVAMPSLSSEAADADEALAENVDYEELLRDEIRNHIARKFAGHDLAALVEAILQAQGFKTYLSPPGPDGGVDVLAGQGPHGFDGARLAVQVKSGSIVVDTSTFREFRGVMQHFGAHHGLIVSWGGFKPTVRRAEPQEFFNIRMWGEDELIEALLANYEALPSSIRARIPLKQTWILVDGTDE